jgi:hypothetical protein
MWDLFDWIIWPAVRHFEVIFDADQNPEARRLTIGCLFVFVLLVVSIGLLFKYFG